MNIDPAVLGESRAVSAMVHALRQAKSAKDLQTESRNGVRIQQSGERVLQKKGLQSSNMSLHIRSRNWNL